jgi:glutaredoxin
MTSIYLYGKPGCHLCDNVRAVLESRQPKYDFELREFDIMEDEGLFDKYVVDIPVVTIDGEYFCQYSIDPIALDNKLETLTKEKIDES